MVVVGMGIVLSMFGAALSMIGGAAGSSMGGCVAGTAAAGVMSEDPSKFGTMLLFDVLPQTQGVYGFLGAIIILMTTGLIGGVKEVSPEAGITIFLIGLMMGIGFFISGWLQGKMAAAGAVATGKEAGAFASGVIFTAMIETFAIFTLLVGLLAIFGLGI